ncbi:MAG: MaoC/PaaZ C-terminal domain-containing protein [Gammaproteobacteria bacterium]
MSASNLNELTPGDRLPDFVVPAITRQTLAVYCGASGDHNPIHVDFDFAKQSGLDDVIAHGMLVMGYCSRALLELTPQAALIEFDTRFVAMTHVGDEICVSIEVVALENRDEGRVLTLGLKAQNQHGEVKTTGTVAVRLPAKNA